MIVVVKIVERRREYETERRRRVIRVMIHPAQNQGLKAGEEGHVAEDKGEIEEIVIEVL